MIAEHLEWLVRNCFEVTPCGSRVTCNPPPENTDEDWLVHVHGDSDEKSLEYLVEVEKKLMEWGYRLEGNEDYQDEEDMAFGSWRLDDVNLIVTQSGQFVRLHHLATSLCRRLNLMNKSDRVALFEAVLYQEDAESRDRRDRQKRMREFTNSLKSYEIQDPPLPQNYDERLF